MRCSFTVVRLLVEMSPAEAPMHLCHDHFGKTLQTFANAARSGCLKIFLDVEPDQVHEHDNEQARLFYSLPPHD